MKARGKHRTLPEIKGRVDELLAQFETFDNASEEFWVVYDELVVLLDHGIQVALREGVRYSCNKLTQSWTLIRCSFDQSCRLLYTLRRKHQLWRTSETRAKFWNHFTVAASWTGR